MKFFTDRTVINDYLLIKIVDYLKIRDKKPDFLTTYKEIFVDPGVYDLTKDNEFKWVRKLVAEGIDIREWMFEFLDGLPDNSYFSFDYPSDMNIKFRNEFLEKTWTNANFYCNHPRYIVTVQHPVYATFKKKILLNEYEFKRWFRRYNALPIASGILGLGNICQVKRLTISLKNCLGYAFENCNHPRVHVYGLCLGAIPFAEKLAKRNDIKLSVDSTKWTRCTDEVRVELAKKQDIPKRRSCKSIERQDFFDEYKKLIEKRGVVLE